MKSIETNGAKKLVNLSEDEQERMMDFALYVSFHHPELLSEWGEYRRKNKEKS